MSRIYVVGSLNADYVVPVERIPLVGETLPGGGMAVYPGGKGANQAVAAARLGAKVSMIGQIGADAAGRFLLDSQRAAGVDVSGIGESHGASGSALIYVLPDGRNAIVVSAAANARLTPRGVRERLAGLRRGDFVLCQLETPLETVAEALRLAAAAGAKTILDPAPARGLPADMLRNAAILTPNETEAAALLASAPPTDGAQAAAAAKALRALGPAAVVLKLGERGCLIADARAPRAIAPFPVEAGDTTAAGDTFNAALAVRLGEGAALDDAARWANAAAAVSVTRKGAQTSAPGRDEVEKLLMQRQSTPRPVP